MNKPADRKQWILKLLEKKQNLGHGDCFAKYAKTYNVSKRTFDKDWKWAKEKYLEQRKKIEDKRIEAITDFEISESGNDVLTVLEAQKILTRIARGEIEEIDEEKIVPSHKDRIIAIGELGKMLRWQQIQQITAVQNITNNNTNVNVQDLNVSEKFFGNFIIEVADRVKP